MSNQYPPLPPGYQNAPQPPQQQQQGYPQTPQGGWVDTREVIGGWSAAQYGMQPGKHIEYKVRQKPTARGGMWKTVQFFKPYAKKNGTMGEGTDFSFNQMKELVERINHFQNTYGEEKGYFVWQPSGPAMGVGAPNPYQQQAQQVPPQYPQQPSYPAAPPAPAYPQQPQQAPLPAPFPPPGNGGPKWP